MSTFQREGWRSGQCEKEMDAVNKRERERCISIQ